MLQFLRSRRAVAVQAAVVIATGSTIVACGGDEQAAGSGGDAAKAPLVTVRVVGSGLDQGALIWPLYAAMDQKLFAKHNVGFKYAATASSGTQTLQALAAGAGDFAVTAADRFVAAIDKGAPITLAGSNFASVFQFLVKKDISGWPAIKGKRIGTSSTEFTGSDNVLKLMLEAHGLTTKDVNVLGVGGSSERFAAAKKGAVDGTNVSEPYASAIIGIGTYKTLGESWSPENPAAFYPFEAYGFTKSFEQKHPDAVKNFMLALQEAQTWVLDPANKQKAIDLLIKYTKVEPDVAAQVYKVYFEESKGAYPNIGIDQEKLKRLTAAIGVPYSDKYNNSVAAPALAK